jgi:protein-disulfide isomerase
MRAGRWVSNAVTGILLLCVTTATGIMIHREFASPAKPPPAHVAEWRDFARHGHWIGQQSAPVTIIVWSDFQCPACRALWTNLRTLQAETPARFAVLYRHEPLAIHAEAMAAARASECADAQGRFQAYHDALFEHQEELRGGRWSRFAADAKVPDLKQFEQCMSSSRPLAAIGRDTTDGRTLGVGGTPTLLITGRRFDGSPPLYELRQQIASAAAEATHVRAAR